MFSSVSVIAAAAIVYLGVTNQLALYIHPRYIIFTITLSAIAAVLGSIEGGGRTKHKHSTKLATNFPLIVLLVVMLVLPARSLTSATASQRLGDSEPQASPQAQSSEQLFTGSSKGLTVADWSRLLASNQRESYYVNKPARVSGFVFDNGLGSDHFLLGRFILTCCAVDARPVGVAVSVENWPQSYEQDEWLEITGEFRLAETANGQGLVLIPDEIIPIQQPENPYVK